MNAKKIFWCKRIILLLVALAAILLLLEIFVRIFISPSSATALADPVIKWRHKPNLDIAIEAENGEGKVRFRSNGLGFIGPDWNQEKAADILRVVNLGDSFTAGMAVPYEENYVSQLGDDLTAALGKKVESLNFGVGGQGTKEAFLTYQTYARQYNPNLVILWFYLGNDFEDNLVYKDPVQNVGFLAKIKGLAKHSKLAYFVVNRLTKIPAVANFMRGRLLDRVGQDENGNSNGLPLSLRLLFTNDLENRLALNKTRDFIEQLKLQLAEEKKNFLVVMVPTNFQVSDSLRERLTQDYPALLASGFNYLRPNGGLANILEDLKIDYFDLTPEFINHCQTDCNLYVCPNCHLSQSGHTLAAQLVTNYLVNSTTNFSLIKK